MLATLSDASKYKIADSLNYSGDLAVFTPSTGEYSLYWYKFDTEEFKSMNFRKEYDRFASISHTMAVFIRLYPSQIIEVFDVFKDKLYAKGGIDCVPLRFAVGGGSQFGGQFASLMIVDCENSDDFKVLSLTSRPIKQRHVATVPSLDGFGIAAFPEEKAFVTRNSDSALIVDAQSGAVLHTIPLAGFDPRLAAVSKDGKLITLAGLRGKDGLSGKPIVGIYTNRGEFVRWLE